MQTTLPTKTPSSFGQQKIIHIIKYVKCPYYLDRYKTPLLYGMGSGIVTHLAARYGKLPYRGFLTGAVFTAVTGLTAWYCCLNEIKSDMVSIEKKISALTDETTLAIEKRLVPYLDRILGNIRDRCDSLRSQLDGISPNLIKHFDPQFDELRKQNKQLQEKLESISKQMTNCATAYNRLFDFMSSSALKEKDTVKSNWFSKMKDYFLIK